jgi:tetrahydromethanopterin S-methyltransferase subunit F
MPNMNTIQKEVEAIESRESKLDRQGRAFFGMMAVLLGVPIILSALFLAFGFMLACAHWMFSWIG